MDKSLDVTVDIAAEPVVWTLPPICHSSTEPSISKTVLKYAIDEAQLDSAENAYTSMAILSQERDQSSKRIYQISTWPSLWSNYFEHHLSKTTSLAYTPIYAHEVVPDMHSVPLYMDIDIKFVVNNQIPEEERNQLYKRWKESIDKKVMALLSLIEDVLEHELGITKCFTIILESHRLAGEHGKYSAHLIMHMNGGQARFKGTHDLNQFLFDLLNASDANVHGKLHYDAMDFIFPYDPVNRKILPLMDCNVYRRNGELRLPYAVKIQEPNRPILPVLLKGIDLETLQNKFFPFTKSTQECYFMASLLTYVPITVTVTQLIAHKRNRLKRPNALDPASFQTEENKEEDEKFFETLVNSINAAVPAEGQAALVRRNILAPGIVIFNSKSTYCSIKGNFHKSNHTFWVVILPQKAFYQRCFDEDCIAKMQAKDERNVSRMASVPNARGKVFYLNANTWEQVSNFMTRHKAEFDKIKASAPKMGRTDIRSYGVRDISQRNIIQESIASVSMETVEALLVNDIVELFG